MLRNLFHCFWKPIQSEPEEYPVFIWSSSKRKCHREVFVTESSGQTDSNLISRQSIAIQTDPIDFPLENFEITEPPQISFRTKPSKLGWQKEDIHFSVKLT